jgi:phage protein D
MGLRPAWKVEVDGRDITPRIWNRLVSITATDLRGERSDHCELALHDDPPADFPESGRVMRISLGWDKVVEELGEFSITRPESAGPPPILYVSGHAVGHGGSRPNASPLAVIGASRMWPSMSLGDFANEVARSLGVRAVVSPEVASRTVDATEQDGETYVATMQRQASAAGATFQITGSGENARLVVADRATRATSGSGRPLPNVRVGQADVISWRGGVAQIHEVGRVVARWHNPADGSSGTIDSSEGSGSAITMRETFTSQAEARQAARAMLRRRRGKARTLELELVGNPKIHYGTELDMSAALRRGLDGTYLVVEATHSLDASKSYTTRVKCEAVQ